MQENTSRRSVFWIGAHKTGTTYLQHCLDASREALNAHHVKYLELEDFRSRYTYPLLMKRWTGAPPQPSVFTSSDNYLNFVFDENMLSLVQHVLSPQGVYRKGAERLKTMMDHLGLSAPKIVLGMRCFDTFLPSLYCETLKSTPFKTFDKFLVTPFEALRWAPLLMDLQEMFPDSEIVTYRAEDMRGREKELLGYLTGIPADEISLAKSGERLGFSQKAVNTLVSMHKSNPVSLGDVDRVCKASPKSKTLPGYMPFDSEERAFLQELYAQDSAPTLSPKDLT